MKKAIVLFLLAACGEDENHNEGEVITTVELTFTTASTEGKFTFHDPDGDGGSAPTADPITLTAASSYTLTVRFLNRIEMPEEDITLEVRDEGAEHQVFFTGSAVSGPATTLPTAPLVHAYADMDANALPIGLTNTIMTSAGSGQLVVTLRHMDPSLPPQKDAASAMRVATSGGFSTVGGSQDAKATFDVTVQ